MQLRAKVFLHNGIFDLITTFIRGWSEENIFKNNVFFSKSVITVANRLQFLVRGNTIWIRSPKFGQSCAVQQSVQ